MEMTSRREDFASACPEVWWRQNAVRVVDWCKGRKPSSQIGWRLRVLAAFHLQAQDPLDSSPDARLTYSRPCGGGLVRLLSYLSAALLIGQKLDGMLPTLGTTRWRWRDRPGVWRWSRGVYLKFLNKHRRLTLCTKDDPNVYVPRRDSVYVPYPISDDSDDEWWLVVFFSSCYIRLTLLHELYDYLCSGCSSTCILQWYLSLFMS